MTKEAHNAYRREWRRRNPEKVRAQAKRYRLKNPEKWAAKIRRNYDKYRETRRLSAQKRRLANANGRKDTKMRTIYGIGIFDYLVLYNQQDGKCAACGELRTGSGKRGLVIDHDHVTGKIRELLCSNCNLALGHVKESCSKLRLLLKYLEKHTCQD